MNRRKRKTHKRKHSQSRSRSRSPSRSSHDNHRKRHKRSKSKHETRNDYDPKQMRSRLNEIDRLRKELERSGHSNNRNDNYRQYRRFTDKEMEERAEKRRNMKVTISVWMDIENDNIENENIETFDDERKKHVKQRKQHIERHEDTMNKRIYHPNHPEADHPSDSDSGSDSDNESESDSSISSTDSDSDSESQSDSESEYENRNKRKKHKREHHSKRKKRKSKGKHSNESESESESNALSETNETDNQVWVEKVIEVKQDTDSDSEGSSEEKNDFIGPQLAEDISHPLDRRDYGGAMLPGEADAIANFVQRGMRIPRRGEVGLTSLEIASFERTGFVMSGSRHKRMNAIRIRKENQIYSAEEKRALAMVNFEEKLNREKKLMAQYQKLLNEKTKGSQLSIN